MRLTFPTNITKMPAYLQLPDVAVPRVLLTSFSAASQINLQKSFHAAISSNNITGQLKNGISGLFKDFKGFLKLPPAITGEVINQLIDKHLGFSVQNIPFDVQYRYDLLKDLVDTYNEVKELLLQLGSECCPDVQSFPRHLMIGRVTITEDAQQVRHSFYKSPVSGNEYQNIFRVNSLVTRFYLMLSQFNISGNEVKINQSKTKISLSNQSIPFYYTIDDQIIDHWDYSKTIRLAQKNTPCYFTTNLSTADHI